MKGTGFGHVDGGEYADRDSLNKWERIMSREMFLVWKKDRRISGRGEGDSDGLVLSKPAGRVPIAPRSISLKFITDVILRHNFQ